MENVLIGIRRTSFTEREGNRETIKMTTVYVVTKGVQVDDLQGDMCAQYKLMRTDKPDLKVGDKVNIISMPDGTGKNKVIDVQKAA
jgi:hypothetical protein